MPSRYTLFTPEEEIVTHFGIDNHSGLDLEQSYNIDVGSEIPIVRVGHSADRILTRYKWGLVPSTGNSLDEGKDAYDVHEEKLDEDTFYQQLLKKKRCIVPANGFYEWKSLPNNEEPFYVRMLNRDLIGFAGLYDRWTSDDGTAYDTVTIVTTQANAMIKPLSSEMPAILDEEAYDVWLNRELEDVETLKSLLKSPPIYEMAILRVGLDVNDPTQNHPDLIQPIPK